MKLKKILCLTLAALTALPLIACGGNDDGGALPEGKTSKLTVEYLKAGFGTQVFDEFAKAYMEQYPEVQVVLYPNENVNGDTETKLSSGKRIRDVYYVSYWASVRRWAMRGWVEPLTDVYNSKVDGERTVKDVTEAHTVDMCYLNNEYWAIPNEASIGSFVYNETMFKKYNWKVPETTKDLKNLCEQILRERRKNDDGDVIKPFVYCGKGNDGYWNSILNSWWLQYSGADALDEFSEFESPEVFKDEGRLKALELLQEFAFNGQYLVANTNSKEANDAQLDFLMSKAAMIPCGSWFETEMQGWVSYYPDVNFKMMPVPVVCDANGNSLAKDNYLWDGGSACWFVPSAAQNKDNAKNWIKFLCSKEANDIWVKYTGATRPLDYDISENSTVYQEASDFSKSILDMKNSGKAYKFITTHPIALQSYVGMWPQQRSPFIALKNATSASAYYENDYDYVSEKWEEWKKLVGMK